MKIVIQWGAHKIVDLGPYRRPVPSHVGGSDLGLGLTSEYGLHHLDGYRRYNRFPDVRRFVVLAIKVSDGFHDSLPKGGLVRPALRSVLSVYERMVFLTVLRLAMCYGNFNIAPFQVDDRIGHILYTVVVLQQVF